jgi:peroxiredoxin
LLCLPLTGNFTHHNYGHVKMILMLLLGMLTVYGKSLRGQNLLTISLEKISLHATDGNTVSLANKTGNLATVLLFLSPECPISQQCTKEMNYLWQLYHQNITFYGIVPGKFYDSIAIGAFERAYHIPFTLLTDDQYLVTKALGAGITPEVFVLKSDYSVAYTGAIDNSYVMPGKKRAIVTGHFLADALAGIIAHKPIAVTKTKAIGCLIETNDTKK